ncbi:MAG TPA: cytochrome C oxidase subunit IV family protein [Casimicrobiaceae bacterium]|jgi:cytochrome c oxidase subunit 4|nr:cytochrome C oxidase subunit IV family protein [Casimicrobiaceae bacterium]
MKAASVRPYVVTWIALIVLLAITCGSSFIPLHGFNLAVNLAVAVAKALLVVVVFMRLFRSAGMVIVVALIAALDLAILVCLTLPDFLARGF